MILGHFGVALAAKRVARGGSVGTYTAAAQLADLVWPVLLLVGAERVLIEPGHMAASPFEFVSYPWTHSLAMLCVWGVLLGGVCFAVTRDRRASIVTALLVPSHWVLDLLVHEPDLPLWPGGPKLGLGAWHSVPLTLALELLVFVPCVLLYMRTTKAKDRIGRYAFGAYVVLLVVVYLGGLFGPAPGNVKGLASGALVMWLLVPWAAWFDRHRA
jgi:hypothetical protein